MNIDKNKLSNVESEKIEFKTSFNEDVIETLVAFSNTKGGTVYVGISDNSELKGIQIGKETIVQWINEIKNKTAPQIIPDIEVLAIEGKEIVSISVKEYPVKPVSTRGRYYKRVGSSNHFLSIPDVVNLHLKTVNSSWDFYLKDNKTIKDISIEKVQKLIDTISRRNKVAIEDDPFTFLRKYQLIVDEKITNACWLLFMPDMDACTTVELGRFSSSTLIKDSLTLHGDLFYEKDEIMNFILKHINKQIIISGRLENEEHWDYPLEALRELVLNMVIHRDYTSSYDSILKIFDDYIEFYNPGALPVDIDLEHLLSNDYVSQPRNKLVAEIFKASGLIEKYGSGIKRVLRAFENYGLKMPEFIPMINGFRVKAFSTSFFSNTDNVPDNVPDKRLQQILSLIAKNDKILLQDIADKFNVSKRTIRRDIEKLKQEKRLKRIGNEKSGYWEIISRK